MRICAELLFIFGIFRSFVTSEDLSTNATVTEEFDLASSSGNFKTSPPEGPPATTLNGETAERGAFTSPLITPRDRPGSSTSAARQAYGRPGVKQASNSRSQERRNSGNGVYPHNAEQSPHTSHKLCQYVFTVQDDAECTHTSTEIAVHHVSRTVLPSTDSLDELSKRLKKLETEVFGFPDRAQDEELQRDGPGIAEVVRHDESELQSGQPNETAAQPELTEPLSLIGMAQSLIKQVATLEKGITRSERERQDLRKQNKNLISTLRRQATARRTLLNLKISLEKSLRRLREENSRLLSTNRTVSQQNLDLRSQRLKIESLHETCRNKIRDMGEENDRIMAAASEFERQKAECGISNGQLEMRVHNLTSELDRYMKISYEDESLQYELEREREKNEALTVENDDLKAKLENATSWIEKLSEEIRNAKQETSTFGIVPSGRRDEQDYSYCGRITSISAPETIRAPQSYLEKYGVWMMDPLEALGEGKVWSVNTFKDKVKELKQYESMRKFVLNQPESVIVLPVFVESNGGVIYNGSFYYQRRNSRKVVRYDLRLKRILRERAVHHAGFHATFAYQWGGLTDIDLAVDECGLWVIFSTRQNSGNIVISKLNPVTLRPILTARTAIPKRTVANAFMACGILYTLDSYDSANASLNYEYDIFRRRLRRISIPFANQHRFNVMVDYNPHTREIFSWDDSYQVKYYVTLDKSLGKIAQLKAKTERRRRRG